MIGKKVNRLRKKTKLDFPLYCITCAEFSAGRSNIEVARQIIAGGGKLLQYREKKKSKKEKYFEARLLREMCSRAGAAFIVNDDVDIALAVKADGVHLGQGDMPLKAARRLVGAKMIIGVSTHAPQQAREAISQGADYLGIGPLFPTRTKEDVCPPVGLGYLDYAVRQVAIPFVAIGGIKLRNLEQVLAHGASCVAMVTEVVGAADICFRVRQILTKISQKKLDSVTTTLHC